MLKKMALLSIFFLVIGIAFGFSQAQQNIPYVDIPSAEAEIAELEQGNSDMEAQSQQMQQEITSLENEIEQLQKRINEIDFILDRVKFINACSFQENKRKNLDWQGYCNQCS